MPGIRQMQKEQTRETIIASALKIYTEQGFSASTSIIAKDANVSHGAIFVHFPTVSSLIICLLERFAENINSKIHSISESATDIKKLLSAHIDVLIECEDFYKRLIAEAVYLPEEAKNTFIAIQSTVSIHFSEVLEREIKKKKIKNVPLHMIFNTWLGLVHYYLLNSELFAPWKSVLKLHKRNLIDCFIVLIMK